MSEEQQKQDLEDLRILAVAHHQQAEKSVYEYACACDLGPEREYAFQVYERIRLAARRDA